MESQEFKTNLITENENEKIHGCKNIRDIYYCECEHGWDQLIYKAYLILCRYNGLHRYDNENGPVDFVQIKEKWGALDFILNYYSDDSIYIITQLRKIENESKHICEICGESGELFNLHNWLYTRCSKCKQKEIERYESLVK